MASWTGPEFLGDEHVPTQRIRCPVHGFIRYSVPERRLIDHSLFQRLRNIRQLALTYYVYPGAMHTRFEHSLGVMDLASQAFDALLLKHASLLEDHFSALPAFKENSLAKARQLVRLMGLLHDVGHPAFSHAGEKLIPGGHEMLSAWVVSPDGPMGPLLEEQFFAGISNLLERMLLDKNIPPQLLVLKQLISGQLDLDRVDYLLRDSLHCGVEYGRFDHLRLIGSLTVHQSPVTRSLAIGIDAGGYHAFEALVLARYYMHTQVYAHRVRRAYDLLLKRWMEDWGSSKYRSAHRALDYDDISVLEELRRDARSKQSTDRRTLAKRILERRHPKLIWELGDHADADDLSHARTILDALQENFPSAELMLDDEASGSVHKLFIPGEQERVDDLFIIDRSGQSQSFSYRSSIIRTIPKRFWTLRLFGYFGHQNELERARTLAREVKR